MGRSRPFFCFFLMIRRPPRSTLFPYTTALPISSSTCCFLLFRWPCWFHSCGTPSIGPGCTDRKSTRLNCSHLVMSYDVFCLTQRHFASHGEAHTRPQMEETGFAWRDRTS